MDRFKSIIKTLGFWLVFVVVAVLGFSAIPILVKDSFSSIAGWVLAGITLSSLVFLFIARRQTFKVPTIILAVLWLIELIILLIPKGPEGLQSGNNFVLFLVVIFYLFSAYLITKQRLPKIIGILLILAISFAGALLTTMPDYSRLTMVLNRVVWALMAGIGIFMVARKGIGLRLLGVGLIIATMLTVFMAISSYSSQTPITGEDRMIILASAEPRINDLFQAWDDKDYQKFSKDFNGEMRGKLGQDEFLSNRNNFGKLISKNELNKLAPKSNSPSVTVETKFIRVLYGATFEKNPAVIYLITVYFQKYDNKYLIGDFTFDTIANSGASNPTTSPTAIKTSNPTTSPTIYTISINTAPVSDPNAVTTERYRCSSLSYGKKQIDALASSTASRQKLIDDFAQLNKMGGQSSTNNYNALSDSYNAHKATYEADQKQSDFEEQENENYLKTHCTYIGN